MTGPDRKRSMKILIAIDGSEHSFSAVNLLRDLSLGTDSEVTVIGVLIPRESSNHSVLEAALERAQGMITEKGYMAQTEILLGYPAEVIVQFTEEHPPDLIMLGAKGLRHTLGILLGGVAQQVVEYAERPVMVVRAPYSGLKRILIVIDASPSSQNVIEYIAGVRQEGNRGLCESFPLPLDAEISIMHVLPPIPSPEMIARSWPIGPDILPSLPLDTRVDTDWLKEEEDQGKLLLEKTLKFFNSCSDVKATPIITRGDAATEIIQYAKDHHIDLIIAGSRGFSQMKSWLLGSVSRKLVHYAACSVLIVKGQPHLN